MVLEIKNINKTFGDKVVLKDITFSAKSGNAFGLLGRNGAGKTTLIRILMNVLSSNNGEILIDGKQIDYNSVKLGYLPEERGLYPKRKIIDQLVYFAELKGMSKNDAIKSIDYWLERLQMTEYRNKRLDTLSKGNQQKIQLITAIAHNPHIVVLDEPFSGLDPVNAQLLKSVVKEQIENDKIVLFSSHQMNYIEEFCDDIAILNSGRIVLCGNLSQIKRNYTRNKILVNTQDNNKILDHYKDKCKEIDNNQLLITLDSADDKQKVMKQLVENYDIDKLDVYEPSLNDIFIEYAGDANKGEV